MNTKMLRYSLHPSVLICGHYRLSTNRDLPKSGEVADREGKATGGGQTPPAAGRAVSGVYLPLPRTVAERWGSGATSATGSHDVNGRFITDPDVGRDTTPYTCCSYS